MFTSNQMMSISGRMEDIAETLDFAMQRSDWGKLFKKKDNPPVPVFQITEDNRYCIGWAPADERGLPSGWQTYPFDYDASILAPIIEQAIKKMPLPAQEFSGWDGTNKLGFLMTAEAGDTYEERSAVINPDYCIVCFRPYWNFYAK